MRIGFISLCHQDYADATVRAVGMAFACALRARGIELIEPPGLACDRQAAQTAGELMVQERAEGVILFLGAWCECSVIMSALREVEHLPLCLLGFPMLREGEKEISTGSYVSYAMFKGSIDRLGLRCKCVLGAPGDGAVIDALSSFSNASRCVWRLKHASIGLIGYSSMSIYPGTFDHLFLRAKIGPEALHLDGSTLIRRAETQTDAQVDAGIARFRSLAKIHADVSDADLEKAARIYMALKSLYEQHDLQAVNLKCQYEFSKEYGMVGCVPLSTLADDGGVCSCEGDMLCTVSMLMLRALSGDQVSYGDALNHEGNVLKLSACGFAPFSMARDQTALIRKFMPHDGFSGIQNSSPLRPGAVTAVRLVEDCCDYHLLAFTGEGLATNLRQGYMPALDIRLDGDIERLTERYAGQHFAFAYGNHMAALRDLARILGIGIECI